MFEFVSRNPIYHPAHPGGVIGGSAHLPSTMSPVQDSATYLMERNLSVLRNPSSTPEIARSTTTLSQQQQQQYAYQMVSPPIYASAAASHMVANPHGLNARRDLAEISRHTRPSPMERR